MSEKVVVTKKQAEIIESSLKNGYSKRGILEYFLKFPVEGDHGEEDYRGFMNMEFDKLATILYVGYLVEETPEEIVLKQYKEAKEIANDLADKFNKYHQGQVDAIEMVLRTLKIEIEGIHK